MKNILLITTIIQGILITILILLQINNMKMTWQLVEYNRVLNKKLNIELNDFRNRLYADYKEEFYDGI